MTTLASDAAVQFGPGGVAEVSSTVRLDGRSRIYCHLYDDSAPILSIIDAHLRISVSVADPDQVTADDVTWGRLLAEVVGRYVAELERRVGVTRDTPAGPGDRAGRAA